VESEVIGTNWVAESVWVPDESSGAGRGAWVRVTNAVPILQWRTRHELDVVDFTQDPADPVRRDPIPIPGALQGVSHGGSLLYTTAHRPDEADPETAQDAWLDASAYDGVQAHLVDSVQLADGAKNETFAISVSGDVACVARGGWDEGAAQRVEAWRLEMSGSWVKAGEAPLSAAPGETRVFGDVLLARNGSALDLFGLDGAGGLTPLAAQGGPGCFGGDLGRGDGNQAAGVWLPFGEYGAIRIGP
jgi:hypothetical protein